MDDFYNCHIKLIYLILNIGQGNMNNKKYNLYTYIVRTLSYDIK